MIRKWRKEAELEKKKAVKHHLQENLRAALTSHIMQTLDTLNAQQQEGPFSLHAWSTEIKCIIIIITGKKIRAVTKTTTTQRMPETIWSFTFSVENVLDRWGTEVSAEDPADTEYFISD